MSDQHEHHTAGGVGSAASGLAVVVVQDADERGIDATSCVTIRETLKDVDAAAAPASPGTSFKLTQNEWNPIVTLFRQRCIHRLKLLQDAPEELKKLPEGFPTRVETQMDWIGDKLKEKDYIVKLTSEDIKEIEKALADVQALNLSLSKINKSNFILPTFGEKLSALKDRLYNGRGFFILRGLNPENYDELSNMQIYVGISSYIASQRGKQDESNNFFLHLKDVGSSAAPDTVRQAPYSNVQQPYHCDTGDIISMYALQPALTGGRSLLSSSAHVYNELASLRPDIIRALATPDWPYDHFSNTPGTDYHLRSLLALSPSTPIPILSFARRPLVGSPVSPRTPGIPELNEVQCDALDSVHFLAAANSIRIQQQKGDLIFWNNLALMHAREGFEDAEGTRRHLVRMWLRDPERAWVVPEMCKEQWEEAFGEVPEEMQVWPVRPIVDYGHITTQKRSCGHD